MKADTFKAVFINLRNVSLQPSLVVVISHVSRELVSQHQRNSKQAYDMRDRSFS